MAQQFDYTFVCEKCGREFYSKLDPSNWRHKVCNGCSGKQYKDYPVDNTSPTPQYQPKPVPTKPVYTNNKPVQVEQPQTFNLTEYITDMLMVYGTLKDMCDEARLTIPVENLCNWTTSIMIQKGRAKIMD